MPKMPNGDFSDGESEKENENGKESFKSPSKNRQILSVLDETEEELKYRQKYTKNGKEAVKHRMLHCSLFLQPTGSTVKRPEPILSSCSEGADV